VRGAWRIKDLATIWLARGYVAGPTAEHAAALARRLGHPATLSYWDGPVDGTERVERESLLAVDAAAELDAHVSLKLPSLADDERVDRVAERARDRGVLLHFDSLGLDVHDRVLDATRRLAAENVRVGATLPGRWSRSDADQDSLAGLDVHVRIVKGQWEGDRDPVAGFLALAERAERPVALATHDAELARAALERAPAGSTFELLYGLPVRPVLTLARERGVPVRIYVPYGHGYLPYAFEKLRANPRILWWLVRDGVLGRRRL
jgi:proline dehydrogenase